MPLLFCVGQHAALEAIHRGLNRTRSCLLSWTTCTLRRNHRELAHCTIPPRKSCGPTAGSESMLARHMFRTEQATRRRHVTLCRGWLKQWIPEHAFGEGQRCPQISKGSRSWAHRWVAMITSVGCWRKFRRSNRFCWTPSPKSQTCSQAWLLLFHCAAARASCQLKIARPGLVESFEKSHHQGLWRCLCAILEVPVDTCDVVTRVTATLPLSLGGLGLRSAERTKVAANWANWADVLPMLQARHPEVAALRVQHLEGESWSPSMEAASRAATQFEGMASFAVPQWSDLAGGLRPEQREPEDHEPRFSRAG